MNLLVISNGKAEDALALYVLRELEQHVKLEVSALSLVGRGLAYEQAGYNVLDPRQDMPTDGFILQSLKNFFTDMRAGFLPMTLKQFRTLREAKPHVVLVCGDVYALGVALAFTRKVKPLFFQVQPLVSVYYQDNVTTQERLSRLHRIAVDSFTPPERWMMRHVKRVFVRDERSSQNLQGRGLKNVVSYGNVMMDQVTQCDVDLRELREEKPLLVLLPGSRDDYLFSFPIMLETAAHLPNFQTLAAFSGGVERIVLPTHWTWQEPTEAESSLSAERVASAKNGARVLVLRRAFAACLQEARVVLGTAGTANEQAAGLGVPVVSFPTHGPQYTPLFAKAQKRLLGDALFLEDANPLQLSQTIQRLATDEMLRTLAARAGEERIGKPGAARTIARDIAQHLLH
ncbi:MAG: lipid-A-disaccharide synthase-related protein [Trueperaceae bacterium]